MAVTITEVIEDGITYRITEDSETGLYIKESTQEVTEPEPEPSELDIIGEQLVQRELETLELKSENQMLGQQIVDLELRLLAVEGGAGA